MLLAFLLIAVSLILLAFGDLTLAFIGLAIFLVATLIPWDNLVNKQKEKKSEINNQEEALEALREFLKSRGYEEFRKVRSFKPLEPMGTCYRVQFRSSETGSDIFLRIYENGFIEKEGKRWSGLSKKVCPPHIPTNPGNANRVYFDQGYYWAEHTCKLCGVAFELPAPNLVGQ